MENGESHYITEILTFRRMPMVGALALLIVGILLFERLHLPAWVVRTCFSLCILSAVAVPLGSMLRIPYIIVSLLLFGGFVRTFGPDADVLPPMRERLVLEVEADDMPAPHRQWMHTPAHLRRWFGAGGMAQCDVPVILLTHDIPLAGRGDRIVCSGSLVPFDRHGDNAYSRLMARRGFAGTVFLSPENIISHTHDARVGLRGAVLRKLGRLHLERRTAAVVCSLAAGDVRYADTALRASYARCGVAHILAVSGLHVGIIFMLCNLLLTGFTALPMGNIVKNIAVVAAIWLYTCICGWPPSAVRASVMFSVWQAARTFSSCYSPINALSAAAFVMTALEPDILYDISFRLSFIAAAAIIAVVGRAGDTRLPWLHRLFRETILICAAATLSTMPLVSNIFGMIAFAGIFITPLFILAAYVIISLSLLWMALPAGLFGGAVSWMLNAVCGAMNGIVEHAASWEPLSMQIRLPSAAALMCYAFLAIAAVMFVRRRSAETEKSLSLTT